MMTNAEAIETLRANYPDCCFEQLRAAVDKAIKALEAQDATGDQQRWEEAAEYQRIIDRFMRFASAQPEPHWIKCSERLPEEDTDILVTYVDGEEARIIPVNYGRGTWFDCIFNSALDSLKVIAWMPLPEPYREGES